MDVGDFLRELGLPQYEAAFRENAIDAKVLATLTGDDLKEMGVVPIGHRRRLLEAIADLRRRAAPDGDAVCVSAALPSNPTERVDASERTAERRPLSVMFCDLVGSTALSSRLDPEGSTGGHPHLPSLCCHHDPAV
jgi:SAM (Sterile alpha motif) domain-containing protein